MLLAPKDGYTRALPGKITFRVRAMPNEAGGSLGILGRRISRGAAESGLAETA